MNTPLNVSQILGPVESLGKLASGGKTSEAKLTTAAGALMALNQAAEGLGFIAPGTTGGLWPMAAMVGVYILSRTVLKARTQPALTQPAADIAAPAAAVGPEALTDLLAQAMSAAQAQAQADMEAKLKAMLAQIQSPKT